MIRAKNVWTIVGGPLPSRSLRRTRRRVHGLREAGSSHLISAGKGLTAKLGDMPGHERPMDRARRSARRALIRIVDDVRSARQGAGLSQKAIADSCGLNPSRVSRLEGGQIKRPALEDLFCLAEVVGLEASLRAYPAGDLIRDAGHNRLLERLRRRLGPDLMWGTEVPLPHVGDRRAWDAVIAGPGWTAMVEAETVVSDGQALHRRLAIKRRDGESDLLILLVADTPRNRAALLATRAAFAEFQLDTREVLTALGRSRRPAASGIVVL